MNLFEIALIGAGQLGSRHLQGLAKISYDCNITVVEPSMESMEQTKLRYAMFCQPENLSNKIWIPSLGRG